MKKSEGKQNDMQRVLHDKGIKNEDKVRMMLSGVDNLNFGGAVTAINKKAID